MACTGGPAELASLVLAYLHSEDCMLAYDEFLKGCPYLKAEDENISFIQSSAMFVLNDIYMDYIKTHNYLNVVHPSTIRKKILKARTLLEKITLIFDALKSSSPINLSTSRQCKTNGKMVSKSTQTLNHVENQNINRSPSQTTQTTKLSDLPGTVSKPKQVKCLRPKIDSNVEIQPTYKIDVLRSNNTYDLSIKKIPCESLPSLQVEDNQNLNVQQATIGDNFGTGWSNIDSIIPQVQQPLQRQIPHIVHSVNSCIQVVPKQREQAQLNINNRDIPLKRVPQPLPMIPKQQTSYNTNLMPIHPRHEALKPVSLKDPICKGKENKLAILSEEVIKPSCSQHKSQSTFTSQDILTMPFEIVSYNSGVVPSSNTAVTYVNSISKTVCTPTTSIDAPKSSSTPRRSSHIRVLDFTTPQRDQLYNDVIELSDEKENSQVKSNKQILAKQPIIDTSESASTNTACNANKNNINSGSLKKDWDADIRARLVTEDTTIKAPKTKAKSRRKIGLNTSKKKETNPGTKKNNKHDIKEVNEKINELPKDVDSLKPDEKNCEVFPHIDKLNVSEMLDTPLKDALMNLPMLTPRLLSTLSDPISDMKITNIPTPDFSLLKNVLNSATKGITPASYGSRPTDYSSGGSYYKPDEFDYENLPSPIGKSKKSENEIKENTSQSNEENKSKEANNSYQRTRRERQCKSKVKGYYSLNNATEHSNSFQEKKTQLKENKRKSSSGSAKAKKTKSPQNLVTSKKNTSKVSNKSPVKSVSKKPAKKPNQNKNNLTSTAKSKDIETSKTVEKGASRVKNVDIFGSNSSDLHLSSCTSDSSSSSSEESSYDSDDEPKLIISQDPRNSSKSDLSEGEILAQIGEKKNRVVDKLRKNRQEKKIVKKETKPKSIGCHSVPSNRLSLFKKMRCKSTESSQLAEISKPVNLKSRRKSATPRKVSGQQKSDSEEHNDSITEKNKSELAATNTNKSILNENISVKRSTEKGDTSEPDIILQITEYINEKKELDFSETLIEKGFDPETAKKIEKDLLNSPIHGDTTNNENYKTMAFVNEVHVVKLDNDENDQDVNYEKQVKNTSCDGTDRCKDVSSDGKQIDNVIKNKEPTKNHVDKNMNQNSNKKSDKNMEVNNIDDEKNVVSDEYDDYEEVEFSISECCEGDSNYFQFSSEVIESKETTYRRSDTFDKFVFGATVFSEENQEDVIIYIKSSQEKTLIEENVVCVSEAETKAAVDSISNMTEDFTPRKAYTQECIDLFDSTLTSIDTPLKEITESKKRKLSNEVSESENKKCKKVDAQVLLKQMDIESVLTKLHGPNS